MLITTVYHPSPESLQRARSIAQELNARTVPRRRDSLRKLREKYGSQDVLLIGEDGLTYYPADGGEMFFHPSTSLIRMKRLLQGEPDVLLGISGIRPGDTVLDCTAGLASDSIVFSFAAGESGRVIALESERMIAYLIREGLASYAAGIPEADAAMRRIHVEHADHLGYMQGLATKSVDIVYFDPMFRRPIAESSSISALRGLANPEALRLESIEEARRVARRRIILKEHRDSPEFERLGFTRMTRANNKIAYGVIEL